MASSKSFFFNLLSQQYPSVVSCPSTHRRPKSLFPPTMASSINALRRRASSSSLRSFFLNKLPSASVTPATITRPFGTNLALIKNYVYDVDDDEDVTDDDDDDDEYLDHHRSGSASPPVRYFVPIFIADAFDRFSPNGGQVMENPKVVNGGSDRERRRCDVKVLKEDETGLYLRVDMPGFGKEDVKVTVEGNTLTVKGEGEKQKGLEGESTALRSNYMDLGLRLRENVFKLNEIQAEMKNGVLMLVLPKLKEEERKDLVHVTVD